MGIHASQQHSKSADLQQVANYPHITRICDMESQHGNLDHPKI